MSKTSKKELPDYNLLIDELDSSYKYTLWEHDVCINKEMYKPGSYMMFQLNVTSKHECVAQKLTKFYENVKHLCNDSLHLEFSYEKHGMVTGEKYNISELEIYVYDLDKCKVNLIEMMRYYKILCSSVTPLITVDINRSLIDKENFNSSLDIIRILK